MQLKRLFFSLTLASLAGVLAFRPALAFPPLPSSFYGQAQVNAQNVADGTLVRAKIGGTIYAEARTQTYQGGSVYSLSVPGDDASTDAIEGGREGDAIQFEIGGVTAAPSGVWHSGTNLSLDLSAESAAPLATPQPTAPPSATATARPTALPTQAAQPSSTPAAALTTATTDAEPSLPAATATVLSPAAPTSTAQASLAVPTASPGSDLPTQSGLEPSPYPGPGQAAAPGGSLPVTPTGTPLPGAATSDALTSGLALAGVVGVALLGGAAWLLGRRKK